MKNTISSMRNSMFGNPTEFSGEPPKGNQVFRIFESKEKKRIREKSDDCSRLLASYGVHLTLAGKGLLGEAIASDTHTVQIIPSFMSCLIGQEFLAAVDNSERIEVLQSVSARVLADIDT